jgi:hypothetical protein
MGVSVSERKRGLEAQLSAISAVAVVQIYASALYVVHRTGLRMIQVSCSSLEPETAGWRFRDSSLRMK